jgi:hypothetical protein
MPIIGYARRRSRVESFGLGFDSRHLHLWENLAYMPGFCLTAIASMVFFNWKNLFCSGYMRFLKAIQEMLHVIGVREKMSIPHEVN